jgi:hypothetical protein
VVGTLWAINDLDGPDSAHDVYRPTFESIGFNDCAEGLYLATMEETLNLVQWMDQCFANCRLVHEIMVSCVCAFEDSVAN